MAELAFGLMRLPLTDTNDNASIDIEKTKELIDRFIELGGRYFDTAYVYHSGNSEKIFGELVADRYKREDFMVTTKMPMFNLKDKEEFPKIFNEQLTKCHVDYFDYYFLHALDEKRIKQAEELGGFEFIKKMKEEGKIKHLGFSFHDSAQVLDKTLARHPEIELVQLQINYLDWDNPSVEARACHEVALKHGVDINIMEPLKGGTLANISNDAKAIFNAVNDDSIIKWAFRFNAQLKNVKYILSGMNSLDQINENMTIFKDLRPLDQNEMETIDKVVNQIIKEGKSDCTACHYCTDGCPKHIAIPEYFHLYNERFNTQKYEENLENFKELTQTNGKPSDCIACHACEDKCPQHLKITELLKKVARQFE